MLRTASDDAWFVEREDRPQAIYVQRIKCVSNITTSPEVDSLAVRDRYSLSSLLTLRLQLAGFHLCIFSPSMRTMLAHFTTSTQHLKEGRYYTLLTAVFSQATISHLATNMIGLYFFGSQLCDVLGHRKFLGLYLTSGVLSSAVAVLEQKLSGRFSFNLGASGVVNGITTMSILLNPHGKLYLLALITLPAWLAGSLFILRDTYAFVTDQQDGIGHVAHLSGAFVGGVYYFYLRRRSFRRF
ncbi:hypothetical protein PsorP6_005305 [Peronosclerospora sorghi]|uniref:Uncharacterized protein n=1 Tax=Peronosclerospora sorghi TaxID=230839 RepID=A0ACC0W5H8_9STRA|nr:hypothetical protein PsorP6_005305 [Peronosclerospora sorghi]